MREILIRKIGKIYLYFLKIMFCHGIIIYGMFLNNIWA